MASKSEKEKADIEEEDNTPVGDLSSEEKKEPEQPKPERDNEGSYDPHDLLLPPGMTSLVLAAASPDGKSPSMLEAFKT